MLRGSRMSRAVSLIVGAIDESRTAAITMRRSVRLDVTRLDPDGAINRLTVFGSGSATTSKATRFMPRHRRRGQPGGQARPASAHALDHRPGKMQIVTDGSQCLQVNGLTDTANPSRARRVLGARSRVDAIKQDYFEQIVQTRLKILPGSRGLTRRRSSACWPRWTTAAATPSSPAAA